MALLYIMWVQQITLNKGIKTMTVRVFTANLSDYKQYDGMTGEVTGKLYPVIVSPQDASLSTQVVVKLTNSQNTIAIPECCVFPA